MIMRVIHQTIHPAIQEAGHFSVCNYETYNSPRYTERNTERYAERYKIKEALKESINKYKTKDLCAPAGARVSPQILFDIFQQNNQSLPEVKALTSERLKKCRTRINQAIHDGCLDQYLADFSEAVKKAQQTPFLRGEGARGWRAGFDWFIANKVNIYKVLEGKYDGPALAKATAGKPARAFQKADPSAVASANADLPTEALAKAEGGRTSHGDLIYIPRQ
jgi:hypothetical protein